EKLGREATVFELAKLDFESLRKAIIQDGKEKIAYTIEFYPEEGKYHFTGHRNCKVVYSPNDLRKMGLSCPVCGRALTIGVMSRVEHLASTDVETKAQLDKFRVRWIKDRDDKRPPYAMLVPLLEIIAECLSSTVGSQKVMNLYDILVDTFGSEFKTLLETQLIEIERIAGAKLAEGISKVRSGDIVIEPGYDGVFGKVKIWSLDSARDEKGIDQGALF
ncbi:MAG: DNA helicase UvrD, partial [Patescibacteria group bacterium]